MPHDIFISHSHEDKLTADAACAILEKNGIRCWIAPRDVIPGQDYDVEISRAIKDCRAMVIIFSTHTNESRHVKSEITAAFGKGKILLPLRIEEIVPAEGIDIFLSNVHWLDAYTPPMETHLQYLADTLLRLMPDRIEYKSAVAPVSVAPAQAIVSVSTQRHRVLAKLLKQFMMFPLWAAIAYLIYNLADAVDGIRFLNIVIGLILAGLAVWIYRRYAATTSTLRRRRLGKTVAFLLLVAGAAIAYWPINEINWEMWSPGRVSELQSEGRTIFVAFTAPWSMTARVNELVLFHSTGDVLKAFHDKDVALLRADSTNMDPLIFGEIARFGGTSVPFYLLYLPGRSSPIVLPANPTPKIVLDDLSEETAPTH
jgi:predicted membrane protein